MPGMLSVVILDCRRYRVRQMCRKLVVCSHLCEAIDDWPSWVTRAEATWSPHLSFPKRLVCLEAGNWVNAMLNWKCPQDLNVEPNGSLADWFNKELLWNTWYMLILFSPNILNIFFSVVTEDFRVTFWMGTLQHFLTPLCRCRNDLFSFFSLRISLHFLFCLSSGKLNREHFRYLESPSPGPACFLWHCLGRHPWISTGGKQIVTDWSTRERRKSDYFFPTVHTDSLLFLIQEIYSWSEHDHGGVMVQYCLWSCCLWRSWSSVPGPPPGPVGVSPRACERVAGCSIPAGCNS